MTTHYSISPYLFFNGRCEEAIEFYRAAVGAESLMLMRYKDAPPETKAQGCGSEVDGNKVMHARLSLGDSVVMLSDGPCSGKYDGFSLSLRAANAADAGRYFGALAAGGQVDMPLTKTFFSPAFGMLTDRFGVKWMILAETKA